MGMFDTSGPVPDLDFESQEGYGGEGADNQSGVENDGRNPELEQAGQGLPGDNQPPEDGNGDLILGKYRTQDDLIRAHQDLQRRFGQQSNELGSLRKQQPSNQPAEPQDEGRAQWSPEQWQKFDQDFKTAFVQNPGKAVFDLVNDVIQQAVNPIQEAINSNVQTQEQENAIVSELGMMINAVDDSGQLLFPGAGEMTDQIDAFLDQHPYFLELLANQGFERSNGQLEEGKMGVLEVIYKAVQADAAINAGKQAFQNGLQQGQRSAQAKNKAKLPGPGAKNTGDGTPESQIVSEIFAHKKGGYFG
ncbi:MAG: hypothetical protein ACM3QW_09010 [Ignavibacteriales bacterium]